MKKIISAILLCAIALLGLSTTSCKRFKIPVGKVASHMSSGSHSGSELTDTEEQLHGTWTTTSTETEYEDGEKFEYKTIVSTYYINHSFHTTVKYQQVSPMPMTLFVIKYSGKYHADSESLTEILNEDSVSVEFVLKGGDPEDVKEEFLQALREEGKKDVYKILELTDDRMLLEDEDGSVGKFVRE